MLEQVFGQVNKFLIRSHQWGVGVQLAAAVYYYVIATFLIFGPYHSIRTTPAFNLAFGIRDILPFSADRQFIGFTILIAAICTPRALPGTASCLGLGGLLS